MLWLRRDWKFCADKALMHASVERGERPDKVQRSEYFPAWWGEETKENPFSVERQ